MVIVRVSIGIWVLLRAWIAVSARGRIGAIVVVVNVVIIVIIWDRHLLVVRILHRIAEVALILWILQNSVVQLVIGRRMNVS